MGKGGDCHRLVAPLNATRREALCSLDPACSAPAPCQPRRGRPAPPCFGQPQRRGRRLGGRNGQGGWPPRHRGTTGTAWGYTENGLVFPLVELFPVPARKCPTVRGINSPVLSTIRPEGWFADFCRIRSLLPAPPVERLQYMSWGPPWPGPGGPLSSLGFSATRASLVSINVATLAAFCRAVRATFVGSITPALTRSS